MDELIELELEYQSLIKGDTFDYDKFNEFSIVHNSNLIEGSTLTKEETFLLLDKKLTPKNKAVEHTFMALDHLEALKYIIDLANSKTLLSVNSIKNISALIMKGTGSKISSMGGDFDSSKGEFRKVAEEVKSLVDYIDKNINKVKSYKEINDLAFDSHYQIVSIHPFADGNGRLSRLLMNYVQKFHNATLSIIYNPFKSDYFKALTDTRKKEDISVFRKFMYSQNKIHLKKLIEEISNNKIKSQKRSNNKDFSFIF